MSSRGTYIHGIAASEAVDTAGEVVKIDGLDISTLDTDGVFNYEHKNEMAGHIVGKILYAKKIFSEEDCTTPLERKFWKTIELPFVYVAGELFDGVGHSQAAEVAAMLKYDEENLNKNKRHTVNFSIEGAKIETKGSVIKESIARKVTITVHPANKTCIAEVLSPIDFDRYISPALNKKEEFEQNLFKTMTAGSLDVAPSKLTGGSALMKFKAKNKFNKIIKTISKKYNMKKNDAEYLALYVLSKKEINIEPLEQLIKARYDKLFPAQDRSVLRAYRRKQEKDPLEQKLTSEPGVSDVGIEIRRADPRKKGVLSHGYGRVSTPEHHRKIAIQMLHDSLKELRNMVESGISQIKKAENPFKKEGIEREYNRIKNLVLFFHKKNQPIPSKSILLDPDHPHKNFRVSDAERIQIFQKVAHDLGLHENYPIIHNHHEDIDKQLGQKAILTIPKPPEVKLGLPKAQEEQQESGQKISGYDFSRMGYGGYTKPKLPSRKFGEIDDNDENDKGGMKKSLSYLAVLKGISKILFDKK